jgi:hypothetical protein
MNNDDALRDPIPRHWGFRNELLFAALTVA